MVAAITTHDVWKTYYGGSPREVNAVRGIDVKIEESTVTALGGASGSGKTTLLSIIGLLTQPSRGRVFIGEQNITDYSEVFRTKIRREQIGFVFQAQYLLPQLTAVENVSLPKLCTEMAREDAEELARDRLEQLGLGHRLDFRAAELSGGELQRVSIARSLMNSPRILIADEPSSSIDEALTREVLSILREMVESSGLTVIVASHDPLVLDWADVVHSMRDGEILTTE